MTYKTHISDLLSLPNLEAVKAHLESHREKLENIKFLDLLLEHYDTEKVRSMNHGVYMFFNPQEECAYIGKTNKQNFAERLGAHFGMIYNYRGNVYLHRTLQQRRKKHNITGDPKTKEYAAMVDEMGNHSISLINVYDWEGIKKSLCNSGGNPDQFENKVRRGNKIWGKEIFVNALETTLQAIYCPPKDTQNDSFLIMPKRGRGKLLRIQKKILDKKEETFAKIIGIK